MEIIKTVALITINETVIVQAISFLIFMFILNRLMISPLRNAIDDREKYIKQARSDTLSAVRKLEELTAQIETQESAAKQEAFDLSRQLEAAGGQKAAGIINDARQTISKEMEKAQNDMAIQISAAKESIQAEAEALAHAIMKKILNRELQQ